MAESSFRLFTDGGARGNPGPAAASFVLYDSRGLIVSQGKKFIGRATNNAAEYSALILGLGACLERKVTVLTCFSDSELMVRQMLGQYKVKDLHLRVYYLKAKKLAGLLGKVSFVSVPREQNRLADKLVNEAIDEVSTLPL